MMFASEHADVFVLLKPIDDVLPRCAGRFPGEHDRSRAEFPGELLNRIVEAREDDDFLALLDRASHEVERRGCFRNRECLPCFGDEREQPSAFPRVGRLRRPRPHALVALSRQERQDLLDRPRAGARGHSDRQPRSQLRRQRQDIVFRSAQHDAVQLHRELVDVRRAAGLPAKLAFLRRAVALREREEAAPERVSDELQQHEEIAGPARERCARQQLDDQRVRRVRARARRSDSRASLLRALVWFFR